jgi:hypothetical protein
MGKIQLTSLYQNSGSRNKKKNNGAYFITR